MFDKSYKHIGKYSFGAMTSGLKESGLTLGFLWLVVNLVKQGWQVFHTEPYISLQLLAF